MKHTPTLTLYYFESCPYCQLVLRYMRGRSITIEMKDILRVPEYKNELMTIGGKTQVPCLVIDGKPLYESQDIISWFDANWSD